MTVTLLEELKPVARKKHRCDLCHRGVEVGERYLNQRLAGDGSVWRFKCHLDCNCAYWSWDPDPGEVYDFRELTDGHLPPCRLAWDRGWWQGNRYHSEIGPPPPCECPSASNPAGSH